MKSRFVRTSGVLFSILFASSSYATELKTAEDSVSYALGIMHAPRVNEFPMPLKKSFNVDLYADGIKSVLNKSAENVGISAEKAAEIVQNYFQNVVDAERKKNAENSEKFLAENRRKRGIKETASGLQYKVLKASKIKDAKSPDANSLVTVEYEAKLLDGRVIDNTYGKDEKTTLPLKQVIAGWSEGLQLMKEGDEFELYIPSHLAYGDDGVNGAIPPASVIIFKVKLHKVDTMSMRPSEKNESSGEEVYEYDESFDDEYNDDNIEE